MRRDYDLMRVICLRLQDSPAPLATGMLTAMIHEPPANVEHHIALMLELGLVQEVIPDDDGDDLHLRLTNLGHDFLALSHCQADWLAALEATDSLGGAPFKVLMYSLNEAFNRHASAAFSPGRDDHHRWDRTTA